MNSKNSEIKKNKDAVLEGIQIMCRVFWGPDLEACNDMMRGNFFQIFETILTESEEKSSILLNNIKSIINKFDTHQSLYEHLNECYVRLFVNSREGIIAPLYESCYEFENAPMMGMAAEKMKNCYTSKGLSMESIVHEPPDHLAIELEYLFFLLQEGKKLIPEEAGLFIAETMLPWIIVFNQRLKLVEEDCRFYSFASSLLVLFLELISRK